MKYICNLSTVYHIPNVLRCPCFSCNNIRRREEGKTVWLAGTPKRTGSLTVKQLKQAGMVGAYEPSPEERFLPLNADGRKRAINGHD
jgi:hypothetical protein